jgi:hypothetical protein
MVYLRVEHLLGIRSIMINKEFLKQINNSFQAYLENGPRSNEKLKGLHGFVAKTLANRLGSGYKIVSLGYKDGKEQKIHGYYIDKNVDLTVLKGTEPVAGVSLKFVMSNYSQNSNNYFENMLGETANIRSKGIPYFQIIILTQNAPYFDSKRTISKFEEITKTNLRKYEILSEDKINVFLHSPDKTLIYIVKMTKDNSSFIGKTKKEFEKAYIGKSKFETCTIDDVSFDVNVVLNDFKTYVDKVVHRILSI